MAAEMVLAREGFPAPTTDAFQFPPIFTLNVFGYSFQFTKPILLLLIGTVLVAALFLVAFRKPKLVPGKLQSTMEMGYDFVRNQIALEVIGPEGARFAPYLVTLFFFVFTMNVFAIIPLAQFPVTSRIAYPMFLAIASWVIFVTLGASRQGPLRYLKEVAFPPGVPLPLYVLLTPIELFSTFLVRPFTLAVRLFANMFAGHLLLLVFALGATYLLQANAQLLFAGASFVMTTILIGFELLVDALQAYIFTILTAVYISGALAPEH